MRVLFTSRWPSGDSDKPSHISPISLKIRTAGEQMIQGGHHDGRVGPGAVQPGDRGSAPAVLAVAWNQDATLFSAAMADGFRVYAADPPRLRAAHGMSTVVFPAQTCTKICQFSVARADSGLQNCWAGVTFWPWLEAGERRSLRGIGSSYGTTHGRVLLPTQNCAQTCAECACRKNGEFEK